MLALLYLLTLTFSCFLKSGYCGNTTFDDFKKNKEAMDLVDQYNNHEIKTQNALNDKLKGININMTGRTLNDYLSQIRAAGGGSRFITYDQFKTNEEAVSLARQYHNKEISSQKKLAEKLEDIEIRIGEGTLSGYLKKIKEDDGGSPSINFDRFKSTPGALSLVGKYINKQNKEIKTRKELLTELEKIGLKMNKNTLTSYIKQIKKDGGTSFPQAPQIAQQSSNFTSGNPGSSNSALNKGKSINVSKAPKASSKRKSTNFSKASNSDNWSLSSIPGLASHYGDAMPSQQAPPMDDTFLPSQVGIDSMDWSGENLQSNDRDLDLVVNPKNPSLFKRALGFVSSLGGASPQEPQFSPSMHDTSAASSYYPSNQPDDQTLQSMITPINQKASHYGSAMSYQQVPPVQDTFMPTQAGTDSTDWFGLNAQNNVGALESMIRNTSSSKGFDTTPFPPNQLQSTGWTGASNYFSPTPNTSNFTSGNPGSSAIPFQQAPVPGTSFPAFPNYPANQSAQLNSSTNFVSPQAGTHFLDWSGENSHNNTGTLDSVVNKRKPSSSKDKNATKTGKKPRK